MEIEVPELGENVDEAEVLRVLVSEGDHVNADQPVMELQTDKASAEMPSPASGTVSAIRVSEGDTVTPGQVVLELNTEEEGGEKEEDEGQEDESQEAGDTPGDDRDVDEQEHETPEPESGGKSEKVDEPSERREGKRTGKQPAKPPVPAGPATRRFAREAGVDLERVAAESNAERVTREHVKAYLRNQGAPARTSRRERLSPVRRRAAERLAAAWREIPHVTHHDEADVTELEKGRRQLRDREPDLPLTVTALVARAVAVALQEYPRFNASLDQEAGELVIHGSVDLGIAVDTEQGLLVPVIHDANQKSTRALATEIADLARRARDRELSTDEISGSTFSITNLGGIGGRSFSPIVNPPEVAILGLSRMRRAFVPNTERPLEQKLMLPLSLSYDHRAIDGAAAARFTRRLAELLEAPMAIVLET